MLHASWDASWDASDWVLWKLPAVAIFLVLQPGAWVPALNARQNQAINEMYCFGPPCPTLGEGKNCTVSRTKHTHLALTSGDGFFHLVGPKAGRSPLKREAASASSTGGFKEPLTFLSGGGGAALLGQGNKVYIVL